MSGIDECFPTVAACSGLTADGDSYDYADHGLLWQGPWEAAERNGGLDISCAPARLGYTFQRRCSFESESVLLLDYRVRNSGTARVPFVYCLHMLLAADARTRAILPRGMRRAYNYASEDTFGVPNRQWFDLPIQNQTDITGPWSLERRTFVKLFSDRLEGRSACVEHPESRDRLFVSCDPQALPYMGLSRLPGLRLTRRRALCQRIPCRNRTDHGRG